MFEVTKVRQADAVISHALAQLPRLMVMEEWFAVSQALTAIAEAAERGSAAARTIHRNSVAADAAALGYPVGK